MAALFEVTPHDHFRQYHPDAEECQPISWRSKKSKVWRCGCLSLSLEPNTPRLASPIAALKEANVNDEVQQMDKLKVYVEAMSVPYLESRLSTSPKIHGRAADH